MIADSLKRRRTGIGSLFEPPQKKRYLCDSRTNTIDVERVGQRINSFKQAKRSLEETSNLDDSEGHNKRPRISRTLCCSSIIHQETPSESVSVENILDLVTPGLTQNMKKAKRKNKNRKKTERKQGEPVGKKIGGSDEKLDSSFNEANYWRPILPDIDGELSDFLQVGMDISDDSSNPFPYTTNTKSGEDESSFNQFNFWRNPIPKMDISAVLT